MSQQDDPQRRILDAAGELFAQNGFEGTTVREICKSAGVNLAAINYYFRDKERLYIEAVKQAACDLPRQIQENPWPTDLTPGERLRFFIRSMLAHLLNKDRATWHVPLMMRELARPTTACTEVVRDYIAPMAGLLQEILRDLLPSDTPSWRRHMCGFSIVGQCLYYLQNRPIARLLVGEDDERCFDEAHIAEHIAAFSLAALGLAPQWAAECSNGTR